MGYLEQFMGIGSLGNVLGGPATHPSQLAAMQQQRGISDPFEFQILQLRAMQAMRQPTFEQRLCNDLGVIPQPTSPSKKVESKVIETVEIRPEQDVKLLKAGAGL